MAEPQERLPMLDQLRNDVRRSSYRRTEGLFPKWEEVEFLLRRIAFLEELSGTRAWVISNKDNEITALHAQAGKLREACKKALTCASLNSDVRALIVAVLAEPEEE